MIDEEKAAEIYGHGWAYYLSDKRPAEYAPGLRQGAELVEWMKGFAAAMADNGMIGYDEEANTALYECASIQAALLDSGVDGDLLEACLLASEAALAGDEWCRWPSVPVRGTGPVVRVLEAANDEMG